MILTIFSYLQNLTKYRKLLTNSGQEGLTLEVKEPEKKPIRKIENVFLQ